MILLYKIYKRNVLKVTVSAYSEDEFLVLYKGNLRRKGAFVVGERSVCVV